jgi:hypothetical protein
VLDGLGLRGSCEVVLLSAKARGLLAVGVDFAIKPGTERILAAERGGGLGNLALSGGKRGSSLIDFCRQGERILRQAGSFQLHRLQLYESFNLRMHPCYEVYGIGR